MPRGTAGFKKNVVPPGSPKSISLFKARQQAVGVDWQNVNWVQLMNLLHVCIQENVGVGFYPASGGRGVCMKLYNGKPKPDTEYANTAAELDELIDGVLDNMGYLSEEASRPDAAD